MIVQTVVLLYHFFYLYVRVCLLNIQKLAKMESYHVIITYFNFNRWYCSVQFFVNVLTNCTLSICLSIHVHVDLVPALFWTSSSKPLGCMDFVLLRRPTISGVTACSGSMTKKGLQIHVFHFADNSPPKELTPDGYPFLLPSLMLSFCHP